MNDYDQEVEEIKAYNQPILDEFQTGMENAGLAIKTISNHVFNIEFFTHYLVYDDPLSRLDEANDVDVYFFLSHWFPRKAMWASENSTRSNMASFRKFFKFLRESERIDESIEEDVRKTLRGNKDKFMEAVAFEDDY